MNLLVVLRAVRRPAGLSLDRKAQDISFHGEQHMINPADKNALEMALALPGEGKRVTAVALGGATAEDILRQARAMGADRAAWVRDPALKQVDATLCTQALACVVRYLRGVDLILLGADVLDAGLAQVGPRLAQALDWPYIESAHTLTAPARTLSAITRQADGFHQTQADLPAVVSVARDSNKPRYAPARNVMAAYTTPDAVEALSMADLGLAEADLIPHVELRGESHPLERERGRRLEGPADEVAGQLADLLRGLQAGEEGAVMMSAAPSCEPRVRDLGRVDYTPHAWRPLTKARVIVAAGRGLKDAEGLALVKQLAARLGAEVAGDQSARDAGWIDEAHHVGITAQDVATDLYIAVGIRGDTVHNAALAGARRVIAIHSNPDAPIFAAADHGIVADPKEFVRKLLARLA